MAYNDLIERARRGLGAFATTLACVVAWSAGGARHSDRRQDQRIHQARRPYARAADPRAARRHDRGGFSDPRPRLSRHIARRRRAAPRREALSDRQHHPLRRRCRASAAPDRLRARVVGVGPLVHILRAGARARGGAAAGGQPGPVLEPAAARRPARISDPLRPFRVLDPPARRPVRSERLDRPALPAARRA